MALSEFLDRLVEEIGESSSSCTITFVVDNARSPMSSLTKQAQQLRGVSSCAGPRKPVKKSRNKTTMSAVAAPVRRKRALQKEVGKVKYPVSRWQSFPGPCRGDCADAAKIKTLQMKMMARSSSNEGMASLAECALACSASRRAGSKKPLRADDFRSMSLKMPVRRNSSSSLTGLSNAVTSMNKHSSSSSSSHHNINLRTALVTPCVKLSSEVFTTGVNLEVQARSTVDMISSVLDDLDLTDDDDDDDDDC